MIIDDKGGVLPRGSDGTIPLRWFGVFSSSVRILPDTEKY